jgi:cobalt-zinc-cadmium efflux system outer membrane protein
VASAKQASLSQKYGLEDAVRTKINEVRTAFINVLYYKDQVALLQERQETVQRFAQIIQGRIGGPKLLPMLQSRAFLAVDQAKLNLQWKKNELRTAKNIFLNVISKDHTKFELEPVGNLKEISRPAYLPLEQIQNKAFEQRPDLKQLMSEEAKTRLNFRLEKARIWDNIVVGVGLSKQELVNVNPAIASSYSLPGAWSWLAQVSIPMPVFNRNQGNIQKSGVLSEQVALKISALKLRIQNEVTNAFHRLKIAEGQLKQYDSRVLKQAQEVRDAAQKQFGTGTITYLEYQDAAFAYHETLLSYLQALAEYRKSASELIAASALAPTSGG